jgi:hypothetical protein
VTARPCSREPVECAGVRSERVCFGSIFLLKPACFSRSSLPCQPRLTPTTQRSITHRFAFATVVKATTSRVAPRSLGMPERAAVPPRPTVSTVAATSGLPGSQPLSFGLERHPQCPSAQVIPCLVPVQPEPAGLPGFDSARRLDVCGARSRGTPDGAWHDEHGGVGCGCTTSHRRCRQARPVHPSNISLAVGRNAVTTTFRLPPRHGIRRAPAHRRPSRQEVIRFRTQRTPSRNQDPKPCSSSSRWRSSAPQP